MERPTTEEAGKRDEQPDEGMFSALWPKLSSLRRKLRRKAEQEPKFRFYVLYDKICRMDTLEAALARVLRNGGAPGVDDVTVEDVREMGEEEFLEPLRAELLAGTYTPQPVLRVYIPKANGKMRPLGIPTVRDRVVQMAALLILEPIFEADFLDCSHGFRRGRSAHDALREIHGYLRRGYCAVYDADLKGYFDSIPHDKLMECLKMRIADGRVLTLIRKWLQTPVVEQPKKPGARPTVTRPKKGTPQGGVISPLLANIYLHWFDWRFHAKGGPFQWAKARLVRYADDFVVMARFIGEPIKGWIEDKIESWLGLELNREKTKTIVLREENASLDFLGFTFRLDRDLHGRETRYWNMFPSKKSLARERDKLREKTGPEQSYKPLPLLIEEMNRHLKGWANYFNLGYPRCAFRDINSFVRERLGVHLDRRSQRGWRAPESVTLYEHLKRLGLIYL